MEIAVNKFVDSCEVCQRSKGNKTHFTLKSPELPNKVWEEIHYDFIIKLPLSNGFESVLVVVDQFLPQAHFIPYDKSVNAKQLAKIFIQEVWRLHGLPKRTIFDRGSTFNSHFLKALYEKLHIQPNFYTAYHQKPMD